MESNIIYFFIFKNCTNAKHEIIFIHFFQKLYECKTSNHFSFFFLINNFKCVLFKNCEYRIIKKISFHKCMYECKTSNHFSQLFLFKMQNINNMKSPSKTFKTSSFFLSNIFKFKTLNSHHQRISNDYLNLQIMFSYKNSINAKLKTIYCKITF